MLIHQTDHWVLKHRVDSRLAGYLILASRASGTGSVTGLGRDALDELGHLLATASRVLESDLNARLAYICRWGHQPGNAPHFHIVPLYRWVEEAFASDPRWRDEDPDGPVYFKYITVAFTEDSQPPPVHGPSIEEVMSTLRREFLLNSGGPVAGPFG